MSDESKDASKRGLTDILIAFLSGAASSAGDMIARRYFSDLFKPVRCPECAKRDDTLRAELERSLNETRMDLHRAVADVRESIALDVSKALDEMATARANEACEK